MTPEEMALAQAVGGGETPMTEGEGDPSAQMGGVMQLLQRLIEEGKIDPQTAEMILQALAGGSGME